VTILMSLTDAMETLADPPRKLNLGCGHDVREGYVNLDIAELPGVDVVHDLAVLPLPFADESFDEVECLDILEHVEDMTGLIRELHRVLAPSGRLHVEGPHFTSYTWPTDPTHRRAFASQTFMFFCASSSHDRGYYFDFHFSAIVRNRILFQRRLQPWNGVVERVVNLRGRIQDYYEATFFSRLFPALKVDVVLVK
jgi:SAM-dependent methyltransferase